MTGEPVLETLHELADIADGCSLPPWRDGTVTPNRKADGTVVTEVDVAVETAVRSRLGDCHPDDGFRGEELGEFLGRNDRTWIVDGIDGTAFYAQGDPAWSTLICLVVGEVASAGIVTAPALGARWLASDPGNAWIERADGARKPLRVSRRSRLDPETVVAVWPWGRAPKPTLRRRWAALGTWPTQAELQPSAATGVPNGAMLVAEGRADGFVMFGGQPWDHAANAAVVTAAGGRFTCLDGSPSMATGAGVYSNGLLHDELLARLRP